MRMSSVRLRLMLWNTGVLAVVLLGFLVIVHLLVRTYLVSAVDRRLTGIAERHVYGLTHLDWDHDRPKPGAGGPPPVGKHPFRLVQVFDPDGKSLTPFGDPADVQEDPLDGDAVENAMAGDATFSTVRTDDTTLRVYSLPFTKDNSVAGVVQVAVSFAEVQAMLDSLTTTLAVLVPIALLIAGLGGLFLTSRALKPVRQIVESAEAIGPADLSRRLPVIGADEFAHLAVTINGLLARVEQAFGELRRALDRERRFTADASHELRTPLTAVKANTSLALKGHRTPEEYRRSLQAVDQAADMMNGLVQDLLLLARSDSGQLGLAFESVDPRALLEESSAMASGNGGSAKVHIVVGDSVEAISGDYDQLKRLVINLLENALGHTPQDGEILVRADSDNGGVRITVEDTGEGIPAEHLPHVMERFYRVDTARSREHGGTGLGLAICKSIVDAHKGSMTIDSTPGKGTRVIITLPKADS